MFSGGIERDQWHEKQAKTSDFRQKQRSLIVAKDVGIFKNIQLVALRATPSLSHQSCLSHPMPIIP